MSAERSYNYNAAVVLCGGTYKSDGKFYPTTYAHGDEFGMLGGAMRSIAAVEFYASGQAKNMVFSTGVSAKQIAKHGPDVPAEAAVYANYFKKVLAERRQESPELFSALEDPSIYLEDTSVNTTGNLQQVLQMAQENHWEKLAIISSSYHLVRIAALFALVQVQLDLRHIQADFLSAEEIVQNALPGRYDQKIAAAYASDAAHIRIQNEGNGLRDIKAGKYILGEFQLSKK